MNTYEKAVAANLIHMQTSLAEWQAVAITGFSDTTDDKGNAVKMPTFEFPAGYSPAPTLYKAQAAACCELCAHDIKNVYWLQNDSKRWLLAVGSECVTRFAGGKSGDDLAIEVRNNQNRELIRTLLNQLETIRFCFSYTASIGYGLSQQAWSHSEARRLAKDLVKLLGRIEADATPAAMAGFMTRKGTQARELSEAIRLYLKGKLAVSFAVSTLQRKQSTHNGILSHGRIGGQWATDEQKAYAAKRSAEYQMQIEKIQAAHDCAAYAN